LQAIAGETISKQPAANPRQDDHHRIFAMSVSALTTDDFDTMISGNDIVVVDFCAAPAAVLRRSSKRLPRQIPTPVL
jgi:hypothetical protein